MNSILKQTVALLLALVSPMAFSVTDNQLFAWAAGYYPAVFSGAVTAGQYQQYNYRLHAGTGNVVAVDTSGVVFVLGPITGNVLTRVGPLSAFADAVNAWEAAQAGTKGTGVLTIIKDAQPNDPQAFHFSTMGAGLSDFDLDDDGTSANPLSNSKTFSNLAAGIPFTVTESAVSAWTVPSIQCLVAAPGSTTTSTDQLNRTFTVNLEAGANVTCTFINVKTPTTVSGVFTASGGPTLQVSMIAMTPTVLMTPTAFTSTTTGNVTSSTVTAGPAGTNNDGIRTLANPFPGNTLIGAIATLPSSIVVAGSTLAMTATSCGGTSGGTPCPAGSLIALSHSDFGMWAIKNVLTSMPTNALITNVAFSGGTQLATTMPTSGTVTYQGKMTGVLSNTPVGGADEVRGNVNLSVNFATGTISGSMGSLPGVATAAGVSTITPCVSPVSAPSCTYAVYAPLHSPVLPSTFGDITVNGSVTGNSFSATLATPSIPGAITKTISGNFYGPNASEISGKFTLSETSLGSPGAGLILIGSFGAKQ